MSTFHILLRLLPLLALFATSYAATAAEWRSRSIYQYVTFPFPTPLSKVADEQDRYRSIRFTRWK
jgi:hypothetical protein